MPEYLVERQVYKVTDTENATLSNYQNRRQLVKPHRWQDYSGLHRVAENLALVKSPDLKTPQATWKMYRKSNLAVPNFEAPDTVACAELALYEVPDTRFEDEDCSAPKISRSAVLRLCEKYQPRNGFYDDIEAITKYYVERPRFRGLPNKLHGMSQYLFTGLGIGLGSGMVVDYALTGQVLGGAAILGELAGPAVGALGYVLIEKYASSHVSDLNNYRANSDASSALHDIEQHITRISIQRELYSALQDVKIDRTPEQFLEDVWPQIPSKLVEKRKEEMKQTKGEGTYFNPIPIDAIDRMVQVAKVLDAA